jgi:hypothetical protein
MKRTWAVLFGVGIFLLGACHRSSSSIASSSESQETSADSSESVSSSSYSPSEAADPLTNAEAASLIAVHAAKDGMAVTSEALLSRTALKSDGSLTRNNELNLFYQAYKDGMPSFTGQRVLEALVLPQAMTGVDSSVAVALQFLEDHGLFVPSYTLEKDTELPLYDYAYHGLDEVERSEVMTYLDRFHAYCGTSGADDFYSTINHDDLFTNSPYEGQTSNDLVYDSHIVSKKNLVEWTQNQVTAADPNSAQGVSFANFLATFMDETHRVPGDLGGLMPVLRGLLSQTDAVSLLNYSQSMAASQGYDPLFSSVYVGIDNKIFNVRIASYTLYQYALDEYKPGGAAYNTALTKAEDTLSKAGFTANEALSYGTSAVNFLRACGLEEPNVGTVDPGLVGTSCVYENPSLDLSARLAAEGMDPSKVYNNNPRQLRALLNVANQDPTGLASFMVLKELENFPECLPASMSENPSTSAASSEYLNSFNGYYKYVCPRIENAVASLYKTSQDYADSLAVATSLFGDLKEAFRNRLNGETWLSSETKAACLRKLNGMKTVFFLTDNDGQEMETETIPYGTESIYKNECLYMNHATQRVLALAGQTDSFFRNINSQTRLFANAFYWPSENGLYITLGYLASKDSFGSMGKEKLFADLGHCMAHELTHGFDSNGIHVDENGSYNAKWWSQADQDAYAERAKSFVTAYSGEVLPGGLSKPSTTLSENIADGGALRLLLDLAGQDASFSLKAFFEDEAKLFLTYFSRSRYWKDLYADVHSLARIRCNCLLSSAPEFQSYYQLKEGDLLYRSPAERATIW